MRSIFVIVLCLACMCAIQSFADQKEKQLTAADTNLAAAANSFGLKLFHQLNDITDSETNLFISPMAVSYALAMTLNGADGTTRDAMASTLELAGISQENINASNRRLMSFLTSADSSVMFDIANSIWYRSGISVRPEFIKTNKTYFAALIQNLDFGSPDAADIINSWVKKNTKDKISQIVKAPIAAETIIFLINAIYFKGAWSTKFNKLATDDHPFRLIDDSSITCRMMSHGGDYAYSENRQFQAIRLPYGNSAFSMLVFLPRDTAGIDALIEDLDDDAWSLWRRNFSTREVHLGLPRMKFEYSVTLNDILINMGMAPAFDPGKADFGRMIDFERSHGGNVFISRVEHKTFLQVDEEGTEAAAVTWVEGPWGIDDSYPTPSMIVDHPFLLAIEEKTSGSLIFIGKIMKPVWTD